MTLQNSKRLYKHFIDNKMLEEAKDIAKKYPELEVKVEEKQKIKKN